MKTLFSIIFSFLMISAFSQRATPDKIETSKGTLTIQPVKHASVVFNFKGKTIYVDPNGPIKDFEGIAAPDLILITDIHGDHFNPETLAAINASKAILIVPKAVAEKLPENLKSKAVILGNSETTTQLDVKIMAIPMYNLPEAADSKHTKGRGNGYVLTFGNKIIYLTGDTSGIPEMRALKNIDVAFVCMNLPYTMDVKEAAAAVLDFKPKIVYPYHYRGQNGLSDTEEFKKLVNAGDAAIDVRLRNWYPN